MTQNWRALVHRRLSEAGQGLIVFSMMLFGLMGFTALVIDVGFAYQEHQEAQNASDAAALAAAGILREGGSKEQAVVKAYEIAAANGFKDGVDGVVVDVTIPPDSGPYIGQALFAEVEIGAGSDAYFSQAVGFEAFDIGARAVAGGIGVNGDYGIVALNPTVCKALQLDGTIGLTIQAAGIFVNSSCPWDAFFAQGTVDVDTEVNSVVGGYQGLGTISISPPPTPASPIVDPLAGLPVPVPPTNVRACPAGPWSGTLTLEPGRYECLLDPSGSRSIFFQPGNYHITGGIVADGVGNITFSAGEYTIGGVGLIVTGVGRIAANNALLYIEEGETELAGTGGTRLYAPTSGPYEGISIFQARDNATQMDIQGTSLNSGVGAIYAAAAKISLVGNSGSSDMQFVSDTFIMSGTSSLQLVDEDNILIYQSALRLVE